MSNVIEGTISKVWKGNVKEHPTYGPSAPFTITVNNVGYKTFANLKKGDPFKEGDKVKFQWEEKLNDYNGVMENNIVKGTLENLSNPEATAKKGFGNGGWKSDPERDLRQVFGYQIATAVNLLIHNHPAEKVLKKTVIALATELTEDIYAFKLKSTPQEPKPSIKADKPPLDSYPPVDHQDDPLPF